MLFEVTGTLTSSLEAALTMFCLEVKCWTVKIILANHLQNKRFRALYSFIPPLLVLAEEALMSFGPPPLQPRRHVGQAKR